MKLSQGWIDHAAKEAVKSESEWFAEHPNTELIIGKIRKMATDTHKCECCFSVDKVKKQTQDWTDQEKLTLAQAWGWDIQTDGSEHEQVCIYTGIITK